MYNSLNRRKHSLIKSLFVNEKSSYKMVGNSRRYSFSRSLKVVICILVLYCLNLIIGFKSSIWFEKSFENEYYLRMKHIDVVKAEENPDGELGPPTNILSNRFLISNQYFCGRSLDPETQIYPRLLILVKSSYENIKERAAIRLTWGQRSYLFKNNIRLAFVLGTNPHNKSVEDESKKSGDIIQIDKIDYYYYSSYKMVMMLRWINDYCSAKTRRTSFLDLKTYVLFLNDDYYLDLNSLLIYINSIDNDISLTTYERRTFLTGYLIEQSRPSRKVNDRWYVSLIDYPYDRYPPYISSDCFLMTRYNARLFYLASKYTRLFHFEQIYLGLLAYSMSTKLIPNNFLFSTDFYFYNQTEYLSKWNLIFNQKLNLNLTTNRICYRGYKKEKLIQFWNFIHQTNFTF